MDFTLREAQAQDVPAIADIWHQGWQDAHAPIMPAALARLRTRDSFVPRVEKRMGRLRVAEAAGRVLGFCMVEADELYQLYVGRAGRGAGVAAALLSEAETRMRAAGHSLGWLSCAIGNDRAIHFYEKSGWRCVGQTTEQLETADGPFPAQVLRFEKPL